MRFRDSLLLREFVILSTIALCSAPSQAAMLLALNGPTLLPSGNLMSYKVTAIATAGETINAFADPTITINSGLGVHQVWAPLTNSQTPTRQDQLTLTPNLWSDTWLPYDTYFYPTSANSLKVGAGTITETKSGQGATLGQGGTLGVPSTGFGTISTVGGGATYGYTLASGLTGTNVPIMQVVVQSSDSNTLTVTIINSAGGTSQGSIVVGGCSECGVTASHGVINNVNANDPGTVSYKFTALAQFFGEHDPVTWSNFAFDEYIPPSSVVSPTNPGAAASFDPSTQQFAWGTSGAPLGFYRWHVTATANGYSSVGYIDVNVTAVPEPTSIVFACMVLLSMIIRRAR